MLGERLHDRKPMCGDLLVVVLLIDVVGCISRIKWRNEREKIGKVQFLRTPTALSTIHLFSWFQKGNARGHILFSNVYGCPAVKRSPILVCNNQVTYFGTRSCEGSFILWAKQLIRRSFPLTSVIAVLSPTALVRSSVYRGKSPFL